MFPSPSPSSPREPSFSVQSEIEVLSLSSRECSCSFLSVSESYSDNGSRDGSDSSRSQGVNGLISDDEDMSTSFDGDTDAGDVDGDVELGIPGQTSDDAVSEFLRFNGISENAKSSLIQSVEREWARISNR